MSTAERSSNDEGDRLRTSVVNNRRWRELTSHRDRAAASAATADDDDDGDGDDGSAVKFRVATYNVLSDNYLKDGKYAYCPAQLRYMSGRHDRIIAEIGEMQPHVICLQVSSISFTHIKQY